jgi:hypothetical protein
MVQTPTRKPQGRVDVLQFQVGQLLDDLLGRETVREKVEYITDTYPHPADAGTPPALCGVHGYAIHQLGHVFPTFERD